MTNGLRTTDPFEGVGASERRWRIGALCAMGGVGAVAIAQLAWCGRVITAVDSWGDLDVAAAEAAMLAAVGLPLIVASGAILDVWLSRACEEAGGRRPGPRLRWAGAPGDPWGSKLHLPTAAIVFATLALVAAVGALVAWPEQSNPWAVSLETPDAVLTILAATLTLCTDAAVIGLVVVLARSVLRPTSWGIGPVGRHGPDRSDILMYTFGDGFHAIGTATSVTFVGTSVASLVAVAAPCTGFVAAGSLCLAWCGRAIWKHRMSGELVSIIGECREPFVVGMMRRNGVPDAGRERALAWLGATTKLIAGALIVGSARGAPDPWDGPLARPGWALLAVGCVLSARQVHRATALHERRMDRTALRPPRRSARSPRVRRVARRPPPPTARREAGQRAAE